MADAVTPAPQPKYQGPERTYARVIGWLFLLLAGAGLFTDNLWHMFTLDTTMTMIHLGIGITGLTVARQGTLRALRIYSVLMALLLLGWGVIGTFWPQWLRPFPLPLENAFHALTGFWGLYGPGATLWASMRRR